MKDDAFSQALYQFEATEANIEKALRLLDRIDASISDGSISFTNHEYDDLARRFYDVLEVLPTISGYKPLISLLEPREIAQKRFDAEEISEPEILIQLSSELEEPRRQMLEYQYIFFKKRQELIKQSLDSVVKDVDSQLVRLLEQFKDAPFTQSIKEDSEFKAFVENIRQIQALIGGSMKMPSRWSPLMRHIHFGLVSDLLDIEKNDWENVKKGILLEVFNEDLPVQVDVEDLDELTRGKPKGRVVTKLNWNALDDETFERLIYSLISSEEGYQNPLWLSKTKAPDRGRDLSVERIVNDPLSGTDRKRVIIQCKHWTSKSVTPQDISTIRDLMSLWQPPKVDVVVIATSGRFTTDAVSLVEDNNQKDTALKIEMWPESHLEMLLSSRPALISEFGLR